MMTSALIVGQTPPPFHGQAIATDAFLKASHEKICVHHVRMAFSSTLEEVGKPGIGKILHLFKVIFSIIAARLRRRPRILYFIPAGKQRIPMYRDIAILAATRWMFKKTVFHFRAAGLGELYGRLTPPERWLFRLAYDKPDLAIRLAQDTPRDDLAVRARKSIVIHNGMEDFYSSFSGKRREANHPRILYVGTLIESKGVLILLESCRLLRERKIPFSLTFLGAYASKSLEHETRKRLEEWKLNDCVRFEGQVTGDRKWEFFANSDIFCFPSFYENEAMPGVIIEAMQFELPVVSTHWRGIPSLVEDSGSGFLVPVRDPAAVAERLACLLADKKLRAEMGKRGRELFLERFTLAQYCANMEEALSEL